MRMFDRCWRELIDKADGGLAARLATASPVEIAWLLKQVPGADIEPQSELVQAIDAWLTERAPFQNSAAAPLRQAWADFSAVAGDHHDKRAWARALSRRGIRMAVNRNGRRVLINDSCRCNLSVNQQDADCGEP